ATVACATLLGLERGLSDPIFGLALVYAGLVMYDAQEVDGSGSPEVVDDLCSGSGLRGKVLANGTLMTKSVST
ncbi:hypothetical protein A2U01_0022673, partial [Trifolium medium]|nr:hypothetical protein [Trifolium medium]